MDDYSAYWWLIPGLAVGLDLLLGDPRWLPHPVRLVGKAAQCLEGLARSASATAPGRVTGTVAALALSCLAAICAHFLTTIGPLGFLATLYLAYAGLALGSLLREAAYVNRLLGAGQLTEARVALSMLVSRDTAQMTDEELRRALAETVSENLNDGFTAPLMWLCVAGPAGMWAYKTISTLDSMWGYKTERYLHFGWFAARADDVLAWIPARITALVLFVVGAFMRLHVAQTFKYAMKDAGKAESPNAGWPMATAAWLLDGQMGGPASYFGRVKDKPVLGPRGAEWPQEKLTRLRRLVRTSGIVLAVLGQLAVSVVGLVR